MRLTPFTASVLLLGIINLHADSIPISFGVTYSGMIALPGESHNYAFSGAPGQRLLLDSQDSDNLRLNATLVSPGGIVLHQSNDDLDSGPLVLVEPGTYTLTFDGSGSATGDYRFRLLDLASAAPLGLGSTLSAQLDPGLACNVYQFNGTQGQRINLQSIASSSTLAQWELVSPGNVILASSPIRQNPGIVTLPLTGTYCLVISGSSPDITPLSFQVLVRDVSDSASTPAGFGAAHSGTVNANQTNSFSYTAPAGLPVYFDSLDVSGRSLLVDLIDPFGNTVFTLGETSDAGPYVLPRSGTYTLSVRGSDGASGNFDFRLLDLSSSPALPLNTIVSNALANPYQTDVYQLAGTAGQRLFYDSLVTSQVAVQVQFLGPDRQNVFAGNFYNDLGPATLAYSGSYYLLIQSSLSTPSSYSFQMLDYSNQLSMPLNTDVSGALVPYGSAMYQLQITNGQRLYFYGKAPSTGGAYWTLYDPKNTQVGSANVGADFQWTASYSGNYVLVLATGANPAVYTNQVSTFAFITNSLTLGTPVTNTITRPGDQLVYTFAGTAGQRLFYDALNTSTAFLYVSLVSPTGLTVFSGNAIYDIGPVTLTQSGIYRLVFSGSTHTTGEISFQLLDVAAQPVLPLNADFTATLPPTTSAVYQFADTNGQQLYFDGKGTVVPASYWALYDPKNAQLGGANMANDFALTLPYTGTYVLVFQAGSNPVTYSNQVNTISISTNALVLGTITTATVAHPGDQAVYTFTGAAGRRLYFDAQSATYFPGTVTLVSPTGLSIFAGNASYDIGPYTLTEPGTYTFILTGNGDTTGTTTFQLVDAGTQPALPLNTDLTGTLTANSCAFYTLNGSIGQQLFFNAKGATAGGGSWSLYDPKNSQSGGQNLAGDFGLTLPYAGTYLLVLSAGANTLSYTNQVNTFAYTTNSLTLGSKTISAVVNPGDQLYYTFTGTAGQRIYYDARQTNLNNCVVSLVSPSGVTLYSGGAGYDLGPVTLTQNGTFSLIFSGSGDSTGQVAFQILDLANATPTSVGATITDSLSDETETRLYRFAGTVGQRVNLKSLSGSGAHALWTLFSLTDQSLGPEPYVTQDIGIVTLPSSGTYVLAVIGTGSSISPLSYQLSLSDVSDSPVASSGFGVVNSGTVNSGQTNTFIYSASAGLPVLLDSEDTSGVNLVVDLVAPDGASVFSVGETADSGPYTLPRSGSYTLRVRGYNGTASGNFSVRLLDLSSSPTLAFNTVLSNSLNDSYQTDVYQFTSTPGQTLFYDAVTNDLDAPSVTPQLLDPRGQALALASSFGTDRGPFSIQYGGTCYLFLRNNRSSPRAYAFRLLDVALQPVLSINSAVTNTLDVYPVLAYRYSGTAGQQLYFRGQQGNPSGYWTLYDPNSAAVPGAAASSGNDFETTLPVNGTYTLVISSSSSSPGPDMFEVNDFSYITNSYTVGTQVEDAINEPGERRVYTFTGIIGQQLIYDALTNDPPAPSVITAQLLNPQGVAEGPISGRFSIDRGPFTLQQSGPYSLVFDGSGSGTGPIAFRLMDVSALPVVPLNSSVTNSLDLYPTLAYRLPGTAGQRLYFHGNPNNPNGYWSLFDPNNSSVGVANLGGDFEVTLPQSGTYSLLLNSYSLAGAEIFQINDYSFFTNAYSVGTAVVDAVNRPGEQRAYTFMGTVGQRLIYDALTNDPALPNLITAQLLNPEGQAEGPFGGRFSIDRGPFTLQQSGVYTLVMDGNGASLGPLAFQLLDVAAQPVLPLNILVTNNLTPYGLEVYHYSGTNGERLYFRAQQSNPSGNWTLYDPNNYSVSGSSLAGDFEVSLPMDGEYTLVLGSYSTSPGDEVFEVTPYNFGETLAINRAPVLDHIPDQLTGENTPLTFNITASDPDNDALTFSVDPGGPPGANIKPSTGVFSWTPPPTGFSLVTNITIRVTDSGNPSLSAAQTFAVAVIAAPIMITVKKTPGTATVFWRSAIGKHYQLQFKNELADASWTNIGGTVAATDFITSAPDSSIGNNQRRFYRVFLLDPY